MFLLSSADFFGGLFSKFTVSKYSFWNTIRVSNGLDQDQGSVGPYLGPNCVQW